MNRYITTEDKIPPKFKSIMDTLKGYKINWLIIRDRLEGAPTIYITTAAAKKLVASLSVKTTIPEPGFSILIGSGSKTDVWLEEGTPTASFKKDYTNKTGKQARFAQIWELNIHWR